MFARQQKARLSRFLGAKGAPRIAYLLLALLLVAVAGLLAVPAAEASAPFAATSFNPHEQVGHHGAADHHAATGLTVKQAGLYVLRALYYAVLLAASGMMLWVSLLPQAGKEQHLRGMARSWSLPALRALLLVSMLYVFVNVNDLLQGYSGTDSSEWLRMLTETTTGRSWLGVLLLALLGFIALRLPDPLKASWSLLLLAAEAFNGHVMALSSTTTAILFDFIHLVCGAIWASGVVLLLLYWRTDRKEAGRFAERFAKAAWISILALLLSGIGMTWQLLPSWLYLIYTKWGILLLVKTAVVLLIGATGFMLRRRAKQGKLPTGALLRLDGILLGAVLVLAGALTYISPSPTTEPLSYHRMGDRLHYTLIIHPNGPGPNEVKLKVWLPEQLGEPSDIQLLLLPEGGNRENGVSVALRGDYADDTLAFPGFKETDFVAKDVVLRKRGAWTAELVIVDKAGESYKQTIPFRND